MCGIAGIWDFTAKVNNEQARVLDAAIQHRGPDGGNAEMYAEEHLLLVHRRLSILDLSDAGRQPMQDASGRYSMIYNGEIFNFIELKRELAILGFSFQSNSDTEVILAAYSEWGKNCFLKFNGMWALALWDEEKKSLLLCRDRFGVKPLYYHYEKNRQLIFASETNAFANLPNYKREFDDTNLILAMQDPFALEGNGKTIFKGIEQLLPGHWIEIDQSGKLKSSQWWSTKDQLIKVPSCYDEQVEHFKELFEDACRLRLRSDVPLATALSGGVDSGAVYCMLHHLKHRNFITERLPVNWQQAFSAIFPGTEQDEQVYAQELAAFVNGKITWIEQDANDMANKIIDSTKKLDFIYNTPLFIGSDIYKGMRENGIVVSMDGHGVDEMLYGYGFSVKQLADETLLENAPAANNYWQVYENMYLQKPVRPPQYDEQLLLQKKIVYQLKKLVKNKLQRKKENDVPDIIMYNQFHNTLLPTILRNFDKMSMQHSIEIRMPFMDWRIVQFVFSLPAQAKLGNGFTKRIVRDSMKGLMPDNIRNRKLKTGLNAPMQTWFSNELKPFIMDTISSSSFLNNHLWDGKEWQRFATERCTNASWTFNDAIKFWPILNAYILTSYGR